MEMDIKKSLDFLEQFINSRVVSLFEAPVDPKIYQFADEIKEEIHSIKEQLER